LAALNTFWQRHPFVAAALVCSTKASAADAVAQQRQHSKLNVGTSFDVRRNLSFILYGALYQGIAQEFIYNNCYTFLFGSGSDPATVLKKIVFDAIFHNALVCIPVAYVVKASLFQHSPGEAIRRYVDDVRYHGLLWKYYAIWMPTNFLIYTFVPTHLRITVMATVSFFWMIILSTISSRERECESANEKRLRQKV
jgi:protein Mpv17